MRLRISIPSLRIKSHLRYLFVQLYFTYLCQRGISSINIRLTGRPQSHAGRGFSGNWPSLGSLYQIRLKHARGSAICPGHRTYEERKAGIRKGSRGVPGMANGLPSPAVIYILPPWLRFLINFFTLLFQCGKTDLGIRLCVFLMLWMLQLSVSKHVKWEMAQMACTSTY